MDFAAADPYRYNQLATRRDSRISLGGPGQGHHPASSPLSLPPPPQSAGPSSVHYQQGRRQLQTNSHNGQQGSGYEHEPVNYGYEDEYDISIPPPSASGPDDFSVRPATASSSQYLAAASRQDYYGPPSAIRPDSGVYHQHVVAGPSSGNLPLTGDLSPAPGYRLLHRRNDVGGDSASNNVQGNNDRRPESGVQARETVETDPRAFNRHLPPLDVPRPTDGFDPALRRNSTVVSPNQYLPPPLTAGIVLPGPYPAYQQHQDRYLPPPPPPPHAQYPYSVGPNSSPFGLEEPRHQSLGSRALVGRPTPQYLPTPAATTPLDPLRERFPTPALKYLLPPGTAPEHTPSTDYAYSLIAAEEDKYRRARQVAARTGREIVFEPLEPIVYVDPIAGSHYAVLPPTHNPSIGGPVTRAAHVRRREVKEESSNSTPSSYAYQGYPSYRAEEYPFPSSHHQQYADNMPPHRAPTNSSRVGLVSGSQHPPSVGAGGYAESVGSRRSTAMGNNLADTSIVRSTRAKIYRKDLVTVDGRQHSVTIVDDDESGDDTAGQNGTGQKRKVGGTNAASNTAASAAAKKRKTNGEVESASRRIAGRQLEKLDVSAGFFRLRLNYSLMDLYISLRFRLRCQPQHNRQLLRLQARTSIRIRPPVIIKTPSISRTPMANILQLSRAITHSLPLMRERLTFRFQRRSHPQQVILHLRGTIRTGIISSIRDIPWAKATSVSRANEGKLNGVTF